MIPADAKLRIEGIDQTTMTPDGEAFDDTWASFSAVNAEAEDILEEVSALTPGESTLVGGGAAACFRITRVS